MKVYKEVLNCDTGLYQNIRNKYKNMRLKYFNTMIMRTKRIALFIIFLSMNLLLFAQKDAITIFRVLPYFGEKAFHLSYSVISGKDLDYEYSLSYRINKGSWNKWQSIPSITCTFEA